MRQRHLSSRNDDCGEPLLATQVASVAGTERVGHAAIRRDELLKSEGTERRLR